jgi:hypothetical protein
VSESDAAGVVPVFTYYELRQSLPGATNADEAGADMANLTDVRTMRAYLANLRRLFRLIGGTGASRVVVQIEPDMWGYVEQTIGDRAAAQPAAVASTGLRELRGLPNSVSGLARAIVHLRNLYAPNVLLGYHLSVFGTGKDLHASGLDDAQTDAIAARAVAFYRSLHARFDLVFAEYTNSDAGYQQTVLGEPSPFWTAGDYARQVRFLGEVHAAVDLPIVLWQIPVGNTLYRAENDTVGHYQDNRVQWLLAAGSRPHLRAYARAGVVALLFGSGVSGGTCACDAQHDGITNPAPIDGNDRPSIDADDDGGYLVSRVRAYYRAGPVRLPTNARRAARPRHRSHRSVPSHSASTPTRR